MSASVTRTIQDVVSDVYRDLAGLQNVLYAKSAKQADVERLWANVQIMAAALESGDQLLSAAIMANVEMQKQRDAAIKAVQANRAAWIDFAEKQGRRVLAAGVALDHEVDEDLIQLAIDFLAGAVKGDASEGAQADVARALEKLGAELNGKGV